METSGWSMRARLTLLAAGVVAVALLVGGPLFVWGVEQRLLEDLRERDRSLAAMAAFVRLAQTGALHFGSVGLHDPSGPGPSASLVIQIEAPPASDPFPSHWVLHHADLVVVTPDGAIESSGEGAEPSPELLEWLESVRGDPALSAAANEVGGLVSELKRSLTDCLRKHISAGDLPGPLPLPPPPFPPGVPDLPPAIPPPPEALDECRRAADAARGEAVTRVSRLHWPQRVASDPDGERRLRTAILIRLPEADRPYAVSIASSLSSVDATVRALDRSLLLGAPLLLALVSGVAWYLAGRSLGVVGNLQREVEQIAFGTLDRRLETPRTKDEVARLVGTLNRMLDRVAGGARRQREFIGDASHELRSPIASIRTQLEVALLHPAAADWASMAGGVHAEVIRMQRLVEDLLRIARLDESRNAPPGPSQEVDLDDLVRSESAALRRARVGLVGVAPVRVRGVEQDLRRVVRNLLENAERYGRGRIEVSLGRKGSRARLEIEDNGPGIPVEQRALVFERFKRLEESRSREGGGAGLGLALARGLVEAHGGEIWVEDARIGGARLVVSLPLDPSRPPDSPSDPADA